MLGWMKRRQLKELQKLVCQNFKVAQFLRLNYSNDPAPIDEEGYQNPVPRAGMEEQFLYMDEIINQSRSLMAIGPRLINLPKEQRVDWLSKNKDLRRLYDETPTALVTKFDDLVTPILGWDEFLERTFEDE